MFKRWEFRCPTCAVGYLRPSSEVVACPNPNCQEEYLELVATIEIAENAGPFTGYPLRRKIGVDKSPKT